MHTPSSANSRTGTGNEKCRLLHYKLINSTEDTRRKQIPGNLSGRVKALQKLARQQTKAEHHIGIQTTALNRETAPAGLVPRIRPQVPQPSIEFTIKWQVTLQKTGLTLTKLLQETFWGDHAPQ